MKMTHILLKVLLIFSCAVLISCTHVAAWERGKLAKSHMALDPHPLQSTNRGHHYGSREAGAASNASSGGGGCGCY